MSGTPNISIHPTCSRCGGMLDSTLLDGGCAACLMAGLIEQESADAEAGVQIRGYEVLNEIGQGGMGIVYRARQESSGREVALKMVAPSTLRGQEARRRFLMEVEAMAAVEHPALIPLYDAGEDAHGRPWLAMLYAAGGTLSARLSSYTRQWRCCAELLVTLARAVAYAHERGVLHRDLKPVNILFDAADHPYVADFGLAKWAESDGGLTRTASVLGSPAYLAPESAAGAAQAATTAHDVYGLGTILYELLSGAPPYTGVSALSVLTKIAAGPPVPLREVRREIPRDLAVIAEKAMARDPARRYSSATALADDLSRWLEGRPIHARPVSRPERMLIWARRNPALAALLAVLAAGAAAFLIQTKSANRRLAQESETARTQASLAREAEQRAEKSAYLSAMAAVSQHRLSGNYSAGRRLLAEQVPAAGGTDQRGIEWHILSKLCEGDKPSHLFQMDGAVTGLTLSTAHIQAVSPGRIRSWRLSDFAEHPGSLPQGWLLTPANALALAPALLRSWNEAERLANGARFHSGSRADFLENIIEYKDLLNEPCDVLNPPGVNWQAIATMERGVAIWDHRDRSLFRILPGSWGSLALSGDGKRMALTCQASDRDPYGTFLYDTATWEAVRYFPDTNPGAVLNHDGSRLATSAGLLDTPSGTYAMKFPLGGGRVLALTPDGKHVATVGWKGRVLIHDAVSGEVVAELACGAQSLAFSPNGLVLAVGGVDHSLRLYHWKTAHLSRIWHGHDAPITQVAWHGYNKLFSAGRDGRICLWETEVFRDDWMQTELQNRLSNVPGTSLIGGVDAIGAWSLYDTAGRKLQQHIPLPAGYRYSRLTPDQRTLLAVSVPEEGPGRITRIALPSGTVESETILEGRPHTNMLRLNAGGTRLAATTEKGGSQSWDAVTGKLLHKGDAGQFATELHLSQDATVVWEQARGKFTAWSFPHWRQLWQVPMSGVGFNIAESAGMAFSSQDDGSLHLYSLRDGAKLGTLTGHSVHVYDLAASPDGTRLVTTCEQETRLWDLTTLREAANLGFLGLVRNITFSADGCRLLINLADSRVQTLPE